MSERKLTTSPRVFQVAARPSRQPSQSGVATNQSTSVPVSYVKRVVTTPPSTSKVTSAPSLPVVLPPPTTIAPKQQGVYVQIVPNNSQPPSSTSSNLVIQTPNLQPTTMPKIILPSGTTLQKAGASSTATTPNGRYSPKEANDNNKEHKAKELAESLNPLHVSNSDHTLSKPVPEGEDKNTLKTHEYERDITRSADTDAVTEDPYEKQIQYALSQGEPMEKENECSIFDIKEKDQYSDEESIKSNDSEDLLIYALPTKKDYDSKIRKIAEDAFECTDCGLVKKAKFILLRHVQKHDEKSLICQYCGKICIDKSKHRALLQHEERCKEVVILTPFTQDDTIKDRTCPHCNRISKSYIIHRDHVNSHTGEQPNICSCGIRFKSIYSLYTHRKRFGCAAKGCYSPYVEDIEVDDIAERRKRAYEKRKMRVRTIEVTEGNSSPKDGKNQKYYPKSPGPFEATCETCGTVCRNKDSFVRHKKRHQEPKFVCEQCNSLFPTPVLLKDHIKKSHMEKFMCEICKALIPLKGYEAHKLRHKIDFIFKCTICETDFHSNFQLRLHIKTVHGNEYCPDEEFSCSLCKVRAGPRGPWRHLATAFHLKKEKAWKNRHKIEKFPCDKCPNVNFDTFLEICQHFEKEHQIYVYTEFLDNLEPKMQKNSENSNQEEREVSKSNEDRVEPGSNTSEVNIKTEIEIDYSENIHSNIKQEPEYIIYEFENSEGETEENDVKQHFGELSTNECWVKEEIKTEVKEEVDVKQEFGELDPNECWVKEEIKTDVKEEVKSEVKEEVMEVEFNAN